MTRIQFFRYVEQPTSVLTLILGLLWVFTFAHGNIFGGFGLSIRAFLLGGLVGALFAIPFGIRKHELLPGLFRPAKRVVWFAFNAFFVCGVCTAATVMALNRFVSASTEYTETFTVTGLCKIKGGYCATLSNSKRSFADESFGNNFGDLYPEGTQLTFRLQDGFLGYPFYLSYEKQK